MQNQVTGVSLGVGRHRPGETSPAALGLHVPARLRAPAIGSLVSHPDKLRALVKAIRTIDWPGTARFSAEVAVVSTGRGRATAIQPDNECAGNQDVGAVRRAWSATAD